MKKIILLLMCTLVFASCDIEDDGPGVVQVYTEVIDADLPEEFEHGKNYEIDVTYLLPDACHIGLGIYANRGAAQGAARRDIYLAGVASRPATDDECTEENENLEKTSPFVLRVDENEPFTFYLWNGVDENDENVYTKIIVPVVGPNTPAGGE